MRQRFGQFDYSLWQPPARKGTNQSPLEVFLRERQSGHCEYFATATVLLLRAAGVPTRYAVGYSVSERRGSEWVARGRDAHAWCLAFLDGRWEELDTTPGSWRERERMAASWWQGFADLVADGWYYFTWWRQSGGTWRLYVFAASVGALGWLGWRQLRGSRWRRSVSRGFQAGPGLLPPGSDSELYAVVRRWEQLHGPRAAHETLKAWVARLGLGQALPARALEEAMELHYRLRFDPRGLDRADRERLRTAVALLTPPR